MKIRVGQGFDVHAFAENRPLILGGIRIPFEKGLAGHSDADVILHALMDALLGAAALGDIGEHFSDQDPSFKNIDSQILLKQVCKLLSKNHWQIENIDLCLLAEAPKINPYKTAIRQNIATALALNLDQVSMKATTTEKLGFIGRGEGIGCLAIACLRAPL